MYSFQPLFSSLRNLICFWRSFPSSVFAWCKMETSFPCLKKTGPCTLPALIVLSYFFSLYSFVVFALVFCNFLFFANFILFQSCSFLFRLAWLLFLSSSSSPSDFSHSVLWALAIRPHHRLQN